MAPFDVRTTLTIGDPADWQVVSAYRVVPDIDDDELHRRDFVEVYVLHLQTGAGRGGAFTRAASAAGCGGGRSRTTYRRKPCA